MFPPNNSVLEFLDGNIAYRSVMSWMETMKKINFVNFIKYFLEFVLELFEYPSYAYVTAMHVR